MPRAAHGLRKAAATRCAENGATASELMAMFGWTKLQEAERYTRAAERKSWALRDQRDSGRNAACKLQFREEGTSLFSQGRIAG